MNLRLGSWIGVLLVSFAASGAAAQEGTASGGGETVSGTDAEARALFDAGRVAFDEGRFQNALEHFRRSYELSDRPALLFNIGSAADRLRSDQEALDAFELFLQRVPDAPNRASVEARIEALRTAIARGGDGDGAEAAPATTTNPAPTPREAAASGSDPLPWVVLGVGAGVAVAGAILLAVALTDLAALEDLPDGSRWAEIQDDVDRVRVLSGVGIAALVVGGAAAAVGLGWGIAGGGGSSESATLRVTPGGLALTGSFR